MQNEIKHGKTAYNKGCRCSICVETIREYDRQRRAKRRAMELLELEMRMQGAKFKHRVIVRKRIEHPNGRV